MVYPFCPMALAFPFDNISLSPNVLPQWTLKACSTQLLLEAVTKQAQEESTSTASWQLSIVVFFNAMSHLFIVVTLWIGLTLFSILLPIPLWWEWVNGCMVLSCWLGLNRDSIPFKIDLVCFCFRLKEIWISGVNCKKRLKSRLPGCNVYFVKNLIPC